MLVKRIFDLAAASLGLLLLSPLLIAVAIWIRTDSPGPALFRQRRIGRFGQPFDILKFRTMRADHRDGQSLITVGIDPRITRVGQVLRRYKIDELPQLINVVAGQMSLVGPRPEVERYVALYPQEVRERVLSVPPGITDYASIVFRNESDLLERSPDPERTYIERIMPAKLAHCERYVATRSFWVDLKIIGATLRSLIL